MEELDEATNWDAGICIVRTVNACKEFLSRLCIKRRTRGAWTADSLQNLLRKGTRPINTLLPFSSYTLLARQSLLQPTGLVILAKCSRWNCPAKDLMTSELWPLFLARLRLFRILLRSSRSLASDTPDPLCFLVLQRDCDDLVPY